MALDLQENADYSQRVNILIPGNFSQLSTLIGETTRVDGVLFDLGVSSMQLDDPSRGFQMSGNVALDMRMNQTVDHPTAAQLLRTLGEFELADLLRKWGREKYAKQIAHAIKLAISRGESLDSCQQLGNLVRRSRPANAGSKDGKPVLITDASRRTFQALRMLVNNELYELWEGMKEAEKMLSESGRLVVLAYNNVENDVIQSFFSGCTQSNQSLTRGQLWRGVKHTADGGNWLPSFTLCSSDPITPTEEQVRQNKRARNAKLYCAVRTQHEPVMTHVTLVNTIGQNHTRQNYVLSHNK